MMQAFRNAAKPVIVVVTLSFLIWLVWDLSGLGSGTGSIFASRTVGEVAGEDIDARLFDQRVQNVTQEQQQRGSPMGLDELKQVRDQVWDETVRSILLRKEYEKRGLSVSSSEVADAIRNIPLPELQQAQPFQTNGQFDIEKYQRWLASAEGQQYVPGLEAQYRDQLLQAKLFRSVVADVFISDPTLWERFRDEHEQVKVGMVRVDPIANVNDEGIKVSPDEVQSYYNEHRSEFERPRSAFLSYLVVARAPNAADTAAALARAQALRAEIEGGAPFDEIARRESADSTSGANGGDLGELKLSGVVAEFGNAVKSLPLNTVSAPVWTQFGYHLIKVESRSGDSFKARHILIPVEIVGDHRDQLDAMADTLETLGAEKLERPAIDTAARALNLTVHRAGPITEGSRVVVPEAGQVPDAGVWAFQAEPGEHSPVIDAPNAFFLFRLDSLTKAGVPPLAGIRTEVEAKVRLAKKKQEAARLAESLHKQVVGGSSLSQAAKAMGFEYREMGPFARLTAPLGSPALIGTAFSVAKGQVSRPVAADIDGDPAIYLFEGLERTTADSTQFVKDLATIRQQALQAAKRSRVQAYLAALHESADVEDRRSELYRTAAQNAANATTPLGPTY